MLHILVSIVLVLTMASSAFAETKMKADKFDMKVIDATMNRAKALEEKLRVPENLHREEAEKEARKALEVYRSEEFQKRIGLETDRIKKEVFKGLKDYYRDIQGGTRIHARLSSNERIYLFVSSSIPKQTLRNYMAQVAKVESPNMVVVMRGFIDGMKYVRPTLEFAHGIMKKDESCELPKECELYGVNFEIDPLLFRRHGINRVPAVVYVPDISVEDPGASEGLEDNAKVLDFHLFYGDVSLDYALERINERAKSVPLKAVIDELRGSSYDMNITH
jgi:conjugal transfer pilus assembly protein TrbC